MPDRFRRDAIAPDFAHPVYSPENCPPTDFRRRDPRVDGSLHQPGTGTVRMCFPLPIAHDDVIRRLCEELNATETLFPGTGLKLIYKLGSS